MSVLGVIPARYDSTRFPGKPLANLGGKPLIQWVWERARQARSLDRVVVATDDKRILEAVKKFGGEAMMTKSSHPSGTDRAAQVAASCPCNLVVNIQGDEPLMHPGNIDDLVRVLQSRPEFGMGTLCVPLDNSLDPHASDVVKVVMRKGGEALYFSRAAIPFNRDKIKGVRYFKHLGLYAYYPVVLQQLVHLPVSPLEQAEKLEQLRALENGVRILVRETTHDSIGVDTPEDFERVKKFLKLA